MTKDLEHYRRLPYRRVIEPSEDDGQRYYIARIVEIPALGGDGPTREDAHRRLDEAFEAYITVCLAEGLEIPEPAASQTAALGR